MNLNCTQYAIECNCGQEIEVKTHEYEDYVIVYAEHYGTQFAARVVDAKEDPAILAGQFLAGTREYLPYFEERGCDFVWSQ